MENAPLDEIYAHAGLIMDSDAHARVKPAEVQNETHTALKTGRWRAAKYIIGNQGLNCLSFYGATINLVVYFTDILHQGNATAANNVSTWSGTSSLFPIVGAFLADSYWGRYWTCITFSCVCVVVEDIQDELNGIDQGDKEATNEKVTAEKVTDGDINKKVTDDKEVEEFIPQAITRPQGSEFIDSLALNKGCIPPMIPLCRCLINERVRELRKDLSLLKKVFEEEGYLQMKGMFILSINLPDGSSRDVDEDITKTWDKYWHMVNKEFEDELENNDQWSMLKGKMFFVWEGNHRVASWMESIREVSRNDKKKHVRVLAQFIVPTLPEELRLITALQRLNIMNEEAIIKTNLKDYLYHTSIICSLDESQITENFTEAERVSMEKARAQEAQSGKRVWYPLTQSILGPMVYGNKWKSDLQVGLKKIPLTLSQDERVRAEIQAKKNVVKAYNRRMTRNLSVVNPANGEEWFQILWSLPFEDEKFKITIEKLYSISCATCSQELKIKMLKLLGADENFRQSFGMPLGDHFYIPWLAKEVWMDQVLEDARRLLQQVVDSTHGVHKVVLPLDVHLESYFEDIVSRYRGVLFYEFQKEMNVATPSSKHVDLKNSSRRLVYRFLMYLIRSKKITCLPDICKAWTIMCPPTYSMYTSTIFRENNDSVGAFLLTDWERKHCPWWIDMKKGECLEEEKENYLRHFKGECKSDSSSSGEMTEDKRKKMEEELRALKEKEDQERQEQGKNRGGRPPSSKGGMSTIKDTRNLGGSHTQKNVGKGALVHAPLASFHFIQKKGDIKQSKVWIYDYIELGKEFTARNFKDGFVVMREFFAGLGEREKIRNGKPSAWSVDLTVIDLPVGGLVQGFDSVPSWNELTDDHVKFSLVVASTVMDDMGWVLLLCPSTTLSLVERLATRTGLELGFRWIMESSEPFSTRTKNGHTQKMKVFYALAFHKAGSNPLFDHESAQKVGRVLQQDLSMEIISHYLPSSARIQRNGKSGGWRGMLEKSVAHMLLFVEALCPKKGTCLELGGGTGPLLKVAMHTSRGCLVVESDPEICEGYLSPFVQEYYGAPQVTELGDSDDDIDDVGNDLVVNDVPSD